MNVVRYTHCGCTTVIERSLTISQSFRTLVKTPAIAASFRSTFVAVVIPALTFPQSVLYYCTLLQFSSNK